MSATASAFITGDSWVVGPVTVVAEDAGWGPGGVKAIFSSRDSLTIRSAWALSVRRWSSCSTCTSVVSVVAGAPRVLRRARGLAPGTLPLPPGRGTSRAPPPSISRRSLSRSGILIRAPGMTHHEAGG